MKKIVAIILVAILAVTLCISFGMTGFAEGSVKLTVSIKPDSLAGEGTASVKATLQNNTSATITGAQIIFPGDDSESAGDITAGDVATRSNPEWKVSADMLDTDLTFKATYVDAAGTSQTVSATAVIKKKDATVKATASASVESDTVKKGEKDKFTFKLKNEGNVTLENVSLKAPPLNGGDQLGDTFTLEPGKVREMTWNPKLSASVEVKPVFSYTANGEKGTAKAVTVNVKIDGESKQSTSTAPAADSLEVVATADNTKVKAGEAVTFQVTVRNKGTVDLKNLKVTDADGDNVTFTGTELKAGSAAKGTVKVTPKQTTKYVFTATVQDADGKEVKAASPAEEITVDAMDLATALTMDVEFIPELKKSGPVDFKFMVKNGTGEEIKNIVISETTLGEIAKIDSMKDATQDVMKTLQVDKTVSYTFTISGTLTDGTKLESKTPVATVTIDKPSGGMTPMLMILLAVIIAIVVVAILLGVYIHKNKKAGYTAFGKRRNASGAPRPQGASGNNRPAQQQHREQRPPQVNSSQRKQLPREEIEQRRPSEQQRQRTQKPPTHKKSGKGYGDRNKF
ncbi:MAG: CARDB domain-containing protein [Christensenella sp.]